jgi:hypothetical protein
MGIFIDTANIQHRHPFLVEVVKTSPFFKGNQP